MGQEWIQILKKGNWAFRQQKYTQASGFYMEVLAELRKNLRQVVILSGKSPNAVQEFSFCSRLAGKALLKNGQVHEAERIYLTAADKLILFISNLNNPLPYRALMVNEFRLLFYELAHLYISNEQLDRLNAYVEENSPMLKKWARELQLISKSVRNLN
jgi:hypothetical protein